MPTWLAEESPAFSATAEGAARWGGEGGLNTACHVALLHVSHTDSVRVGEAIGQHTGSCLLAGTNLEVLC